MGLWDDQVDVVDMVAELTRPHEHGERYAVKVGQTTYGRRHLTKVPPLLVQLEHASPSGEGEERTNGGYTSRPAARLESLDTMIMIDKEASRWVREHGDDDAGMSTLDCVKRLGALMPSMDRCTRHGGRSCCAWHAAEADIKRWWTQARIVAGWDSAAWRPDNTCPMCEQRGGLRVRLSVKVGVCVDCRETWGPETIGLLADHIRAESMAERVSTRAPAACAPVPGYEPDELRALCPRCGSARCHRAVAVLLEQAAS